MSIEKITEDVITAARSGGGDPNAYPALSLAYLGDCVYELYIRTHLAKGGGRKVNDLHKTATRFVCAKAQAEFYHRIEGILTDNESAAFRRGRNAKSHPPKNADVIDYKLATGVEALLGYLYIKGETKRITELMEFAAEM